MLTNLICMWWKLAQLFNYLKLQNWNNQLQSYKVARSKWYLGSGWKAHPPLSKILSSSSSQLHRYTDTDYTDYTDYTDTQLHKYTDTDYTDTQIHRYTNTQIHKYTDSQIHKYTHPPLSIRSSPHLPPSCRLPKSNWVCLGGKDWG